MYFSQFRFKWPVYVTFKKKNSWPYTTEMHVQGWFILSNEYINELTSSDALQNTHTDSPSLPLSLSLSLSLGNDT